MGEEMIWHRRYGKFHAQDYVVSWLVILFYLLFAAACFVLDLSLFGALLIVVLALIQLLSVLLPHCEQFSIQGDTITVRKLGKTRQISIPSKAVVIVSDTDICPPLAVRTAVGNQTHIMHGQYSLSILQEMPLTCALRHLHGNYVKKYTSSTIRFSFDEYEYVYSFVFDSSLLNQILANRTCQLIVPKSLLDTVAQCQSRSNIYVDDDF